ncbi:carbohydrate ABC transporter permease [Blautia liquoris]|uniref:Carbohydrate ABC transporter permease n=1 Tax=Blautia liquoris TaxID=2779518 RepID=A0A7M2REV4_9FIRM|nr:carbohydrate ABC transporter permease [Blautia liquoris]QOV18779.1 carbohydrate ABC transporter permease [Blautia liquoris]
MKNNVKYQNHRVSVFRIINTLFLSLLMVMCLFPIVHILAISLSNQAAVSANKVLFWPVGFTFASYKVVAKRAAFWRSFGISIERVIIGVLVNTILTLLMAYPLSKTEEQFKARKYYVWILIFAMIFDGGLVPNYLLVKKMGLFDTMMALILPMSVPIYNVILAMNFMKQLPYTIEEAAMMDGASYFQRFLRIILPLSKPMIATITLFSFLTHWNSWFDGKIYMNNSANYPLQTYLQALITKTTLTNAADAIEQALSNAKTLQAAQLFLTLLPILVIYPFLQKYFTKGLTVGAVKG